MTLLLCVLLVLVAANVATNLLPQRWYVLVCVLGSSVLLWLGWLGGLSAQDLGLGRGTVLPGLAWAAVLVLVVGIAYASAAAIPRLHVAFADRRAMDASGPEAARQVLLRIPFGTVLLEETAFRGVLFGALTVWSSSLVAVIVTASLFGLWHVLPARAMHGSHEALTSAVGRGVRGKLLAIGGTVLFTACGGVVFALLRLWSGSLLPPIGLHWSLNGLGVTVAWLLARRSRSQRGQVNPIAPVKDDR